MKIAQFHNLIAQARMTIDAHQAGKEVAQELLEWSRNLLASNPTAKTCKPRPRQDWVLDFFLGNPTRYVTRRMVLEGDPSMPGWKVDHDIKMMVDDGLLYPFQSGLGVGRRYYLTAEARAAGAANLAEETRANEEQKKERRRAADRKRDAVRRKKKPKPKQITFSKKADRSVERPMGKQTRIAEMVIPPGLVITQCPNYEDRRFKVEGPIIGGFLSEFHSLRGTKGPT